MWGGRFVRGLGSAVAMLLATDAFAADAYPTRPITFVVPFAAGGPTDVVARVVAQKMSAAIGQAIVVENRGGAGGRNGAEFVARAAPDGYTLLVANVSSHAIVPVTVSKIGYDPIKSFTAIAPIGSYPLVMICNPKVPAKDVKDLIAYAKKNPGKLTFGSPGAGGQGHLAGEFFKSRAGVDMLHVPYKGAAPLLQDVIAGTVDCMYDGTSQAHIASGAVRAFALTSGARDPRYPGVPTFEEEGLKGLDMMTWMALEGPAGLSQGIVKKLNDAANAAEKDPKVVEAAGLVGTTIGGGTPADVEARIKHDLTMYRDVVREAHIRVE